MTFAWIIGGGLAAAATAHEFRQHGIDSFVFEKEKRWGGLVRSDVMEGVIYEPHGSHIFHTDDREVAELLFDLVPFNDYKHSVTTVVRNQHLTWPIQEDEIRRVYGDKVADNLIAYNLTDHHGVFVNRRPVLKTKDLNFEEWCRDMMPEEVYQDFIKCYTEKQWGISADQLSADFAPKRVQVRTDGDKNLFKDRYQGFPDARRGGSWEEVLRKLYGCTLEPSYMHTGIKMTLDKLRKMLLSYPRSWRPDWIVITAPLDDFAANKFGKMEWRGLVFDHKVMHPKGGFAQECMVVNWPGKEYPWIRTHETKHASRQDIEATVLTTEFPGGNEKFYPVPGLSAVNRKTNEKYQHYIAQKIRPLGPSPLFLGRLASFAYMDTDDVIRQAMDVVRHALNPVAVA